MKIKGTYNRIKEKLSASLLHSLTLTLLDAKKKGNHRLLQSLHQLIFDNDLPEKEDGNKLFIELVNLVHPDRLEHISGEVEKALDRNDGTTLEFYNRILNSVDSLKQIHEAPNRFKVETDEFYSYGEEDFDQAFEGRDWEFQDYSIREEKSNFNFIRAVQAEFLGSMDVQFNPADLTSLSGEVDLSDYGIMDLDGLEYCLNITHLNLSHNRISNIHEISGLHNLKELYLGVNLITDISALEGLSDLEILDISNNDIEDFAPLLKLTNLEFVCISGNPVGADSVLGRLKANGVIII